MKWIENLGDSRSVFRSQNGNFILEKSGYSGSITQIDDKVAYDPYVQRAIQRKKLTLIDEENALGRISGLPVWEDPLAVGNDPAEFLREGISERSQRYAEGVPDSHREGVGTRAEDILSPQGAHQQTVTRSDGAAVGEPGDTRVSAGFDMEAAIATIDPDSPSVPTQSVLTAPVREGEWTPDVGEVL